MLESDKTNQKEKYQFRVDMLTLRTRSSRDVAQKPIHLSNTVYLGNEYGDLPNHYSQEYAECAISQDIGENRIATKSRGIEYKNGRPDSFHNSDNNIPFVKKINFDSLFEAFTHRTIEPMMLLTRSARRSPEHWWSKYF